MVLCGVAALLAFRVPSAAAAGGTFTVNTTVDHDDGTCAPLTQLTDCTLREAINAVNTAPTTDTISFSIAGAGVHSIAPTAPLPTLTGAVTIDGTTQPGYAGSPLIELNGTSAGPTAHGLWLAGGASTVRGLAINRFGGNGIVLASQGGDVVAANRVGTDPSGTVDLGNAGIGVLINFVSDNVIGGSAAADGNVISGNESTGIEVRGGHDNRIASNLVGTDAAGTAALGNTASAVVLDATSSNIIGGTAGDGNVISGNGIDGVHIQGVTPTANLIEGNRIGTTAAGTAALPNGGNGVTLAHGSGNVVGGASAGAGNLISGNTGFGVWITSNSNSVAGNRIGSDASGNAAVANSAGVVVQDASSNTVGGTTSAAANLVSGNRSNGVLITASPTTSATSNLVQGNQIGTNAAGNAGLANPSGGVLIQNSSGNTIGGSTAGAGNLISGSAAYGVRLVGAGSTQNAVAGNAIGFKADRSGGLGGLIGVLIDFGASQNAVGGVGAGEANLIAYQSRDGIQVQSGTANALRGNVIFGNGRLAIDLNASPTSNSTGDGVTANDQGDADTGANELQNYPVVGAVVANGAATVTGTIDSHPSTQYSVDLFFAGACDASGHGEADAALGSTEVTTDAAGHGSFSVPVGVLEDGVVTATATDSAGNTSELSECGAINHAPVADAGPDLSVTSGAGFDLDGTGSLDADQQALTYRWEQVEGPPVTITGADTPQAHVNGITGPATLRFRLTVTDSGGATDTDMVTATVAPK